MHATSRSCLTVLAWTCLVAAVKDCRAVDDLPSVRIRRATHGPKHHFFGYYGITPWNRSERYLVCLESEFQDRLPGPNEPAAIGLIDAQGGSFRKVAQTTAWNFQQGAMLHWNPLRPENEIIYNDRRDGKIVAVVLDVQTGKQRVLPRPVSAVSHHGRYALSLTYGRLRRLRKVVGYVGAEDPSPDDPHPATDGVFLMDLASGDVRLVVSIETIYRLLARKHPDLEDCHLWFNHTVFNKTDTRFFFLARGHYPARARRFETCMFTADLQGNDLREVVPFGMGVSHFDWRNDKQIVATFRPAGFSGKPHFLLDDSDSPGHRRIGEGFLDGDGHCSFDPTGTWLVSDPGDGKIGGRALKLLNVETGQRAVLGKFALGRYRSGDLRCDLHPRWSRSGSAICFDAIDAEDGSRQLFVAELQLKASSTTAGD